MNSNKYTLSLLNHGLYRGLITNSYIEKFQIGSMDILKRLIVKYTFGESSSVRVETAENLLLSIYYSIDAYMASLEKPEEGIAIMDEAGLEEVYTRGVNEVKSCLENCKILYEDVKRTKLDIQLLAYTDTIEKAIPDFLVWYNPLFSAHDTMCTIDYPLAIDDMSIQGAFYIKQYLERLILETNFCQYFDQEAINNLLENYGILYKMNYREALINVFEIVFSNYLFGLMVGKKDRELQISDTEYEDIVNKLGTISLNDVTDLIHHYFDDLINSLEIQNHALITYIHAYKRIFIERVLRNIRDGDMTYMIITNQIEDKQDLQLLDMDSTLEDEVFKELVNNIIECTRVQDKVLLISTHVRSLIDFIDILKADCIFGEEFDQVFDILEDMELAILAKIIYGQEVRFSDMTFSEINLEELDEEWQWSCLEFINHLDDERKDRIEHLMKKYNFQVF